METTVSDSFIRISVTSSHELSRLEASQLTNLLTADRVAVAIDLSAVKMLHSPDLAHLVDLYKALSARGVGLQLSQVSTEIRKILTMTRLDQLFTVV